jgi:putative transposase
MLKIYILTQEYYLTMTSCISFRRYYGPEFIAKEFIMWATKHNIIIDYIQPGKPAQNAYIERFNRTYREDVLDIYLFATVEEVQGIIDKWLNDYNQNRPHESLKNLSLLEFSCAMEGMPSIAQKEAVVQLQQF